MGYASIFIFRHRNGAGITPVGFKPTGTQWYSYSYSMQQPLCYYLLDLATSHLILAQSLTCFRSSEGLCMYLAVGRNALFHPMCARLAGNSREACARAKVSNIQRGIMWSAAAQQLMFSAVSPRKIAGICTSRDLTFTMHTIISSVLPPESQIKPVGLWLNNYESNDWILGSLRIPQLGPRSIRRLQPQWPGINDIGIVIGGNNRHSSGAGILNLGKGTS